MSKEYEIGLKFYKRYGAIKRELEIEDVYKTYNSKNELVKTEYKCFYMLNNQKVYDYVCSVTIFRGLKGK